MIVGRRSENDFQHLQEFTNATTLYAIHSVTYSSLALGRTHNVMLRNQLVLIHLTEDITSADNISLLKVHGLVKPLALSTC